MKKLFLLSFVIFLFSCESPVEPVTPDTDIICLNTDITTHPLNFKIISTSEIKNLILNDEEILFENIGGNYYFSTNEMMIHLSIIYKNNLSTEHFLYYRY